MQTNQVISRRSLDQLEDEICTLSQRINASEYEFLVLVREFDLRQGWKPYHFNNCAEWLNFRCGISPATAREKIRVANALIDLPLMSGAFQGGELSYSKARALTRVANPRTESGLLDYAIPATALQVEEHSRKLRNVLRDASTVDAQRLHKERYLSSSCHGDGSMTISVELPRESGELVMKALEMALAQSRDGGEAEPSNAVDSFQTTQADALVLLARSFLAGDGGKSSCTADHYQVVVHVDEEALRGRPTPDSKSDLPIETVRRLCCDSAVVVVEDDPEGTPLNVGRKHRIVQPALKRALVARDRLCRFPGCTNSKWLDAQGLPRCIGHHVTHWADGGDTSLENTMLLCSRHHRLLHEGKFEIKPGPQGDWQFKNGHMT